MKWLLWLWSFLILRAEDGDGGGSTDAPAGDSPSPAESDAKPAGESSGPAPAETEPESPPAAPAPSDETGESSTPKAAKKPANSFEAAREALKRDREAKAKAAGETSPPPRKEGTDAKDAQAAKAEETETYEPIKDPKKGAERRVNQLLDERRTLLPKATQYDLLTGWAKDNNLSGDGVTTALTVAAISQKALDTNDPQVARQALQALDSVRATLLTVAGIVTRLPDDLAAKVDDGVLNETDAREIAAMRLRTHSSERALADRQERDEAIRAHGEQQAVANAVGAAVSAWETGIASKDPDFSKLRPLVIAKLHELWQTEGRHGDPAKAVQQAASALKFVKDQFSGVIPPKPELRPINGGTNPRKVRGTPKTSLEAALMALGRA